MLSTYILLVGIIVVMTIFALPAIIDDARRHHQDKKSTNEL